MRANKPLTRSFVESSYLVCTHCGAFAKVVKAEGPYDEGPFHRFYVTLENRCQFTIEQDLRRAMAELN